MVFFTFGRYKVGQVDQHDDLKKVDQVDQHGEKWARSISMMKSGPGRSA